MKKFFIILLLLFFGNFYSSNNNNKKVEASIVYCISDKNFVALSYGMTVLGLIYKAALSKNFL